MVSSQGFQGFQPAGCMWAHEVQGDGLEAHPRAAAGPLLLSTLRAPTGLPQGSPYRHAAWRLAWATAACQHCHPPGAKPPDCLSMGNVTSANGDKTAALHLPVCGRAALF